MTEIIVCLNGQIAVTLTTAAETEVVELATRDRGLYIAPLVWLDVAVLQDDTICLVLRSQYFNESDYIRDFEEFRGIVEGKIEV